MRKGFKYLLVLLVVTLSIFSYFYLNDVKTHTQLPSLSQSEIPSQQYTDETDRNMLPESKVVRFFIEKAAALLNPVLRN